MSKPLSESGKVIHDLLDLIDQYMTPAVRNMAMSDLRYTDAKKYLGEYKRNLIWENSGEYTLGECFAITDVGIYYIVEELNTLKSLQFEDYVLAVTEDGNIEKLKEHAESDYIYRHKLLQKVS